MRKRSDVVDHASWSFAEDQKLMSDIEALARVMSVTQGVEFPDLHQEMLLWFAVRPEHHHLDHGLIIHKLKGVGVDAGNRQRTRGSREQSLDQIMDREVA